MAVIRKNEIRKLTPKEAEAKIIQLERTLLELDGEGKHDRKKPVKKAIAKLKTLISMSKKGLNIRSASNTNIGKR